LSVFKDSVPPRPSLEGLSWEQQNLREQIWHERLTTARRIHSIAAAYFRRTVERAQTERWDHEADGVIALRKAKDVERVALENYLQVLKTYNAVVVEGRLPQ
jgi:hypothetical protein